MHLEKSAQFPLEEMSAAEKRAFDQLFSLVYEELRRLASSIRRKGQGSPLDSTALVHEAWLKLKDYPSLPSDSRTHFKALAAKAMRQIFVDEARQRSAQKRGGDGLAVFVGIDDSVETISRDDAGLLALDAALDELKSINPRQASMVESRFFGGFSVAETATLLGVSESAIERDWRATRAWLRGKLRTAGKR